MKALKTFALISLAVPFLLLAEEEPSHIPVGTRGKPKAESDQKAVMQSSSRSAGFFDTAPRVYSSSSLHWLYKAEYDTLELEDGSIWKVAPRDQYRFSSWLLDDAILIAQNDRWFSRYKYRIINRHTRVSIEANLSLGPIVNGKFTRYISAIDQGRGELILSDNTGWEVAEADAEIFRDWILNDAILIGVNGFGSSRYENILINVNMNNYVRVRQY